MNLKKSRVLAVLVFSLLLGLSPLAADSIIERGIDVFTTPPDGNTFYDFARNPIPAGFFCEKSKPFGPDHLPLPSPFPGASRTAQGAWTSWSSIPMATWSLTACFPALPTSSRAANGQARRTKSIAVGSIPVTPLKATSTAFPISPGAARENARRVVV